MPHIEAAKSRGAKSLSSKTLDELYRWRVRGYELGCGHSGNELPKKNPETQQNLWKKNSTYIPKSLPLAIHRISILNEPVVVHGKSTQLQKNCLFTPKVPYDINFFFFLLWQLSGYISMLCGYIIYLDIFDGCE